MVLKTASLSGRSAWRMHSHCQLGKNIFSHVSYLFPFLMFPITVEGKYGSRGE